MRRFIVTAVLAFVILAMLAPPGFAQAPAPKVTITGLFDQITSMGRNTYDGNLTRNSDKEWYARTRFRPDIEFAVGRVKAVLGLELDFQYGQSGPNDGGYPGNTSGAACGAAAGAAGGNAGSSPPGGKVNISGCLDLNTDVAGLIEVKWIYTEFPLTGKDSLLPFIPVETMARAGGQPFDYPRPVQTRPICERRLRRRIGDHDVRAEHQDQPRLRPPRGGARRLQPR